ncbi:MAG: rRNA pseudouridine synthase [Treponema sp.]|nr:rRNA pseudouridine synthase [Treponema sp.]
MKENTEIPLGIRLHVFLAHAGVASRRAAEKLIAEGRIAVNGRVISGPGEKVLPTDEVRFDGKEVKIEERLEYLVLHKPPLYICSSYDPQGRPLALELLPPADKTGRPLRLYNVGRLDYLSSGLIIFTNDGAFAARLGHPSSEIEKEYLIDSTVPIQDRMIEEFSRGLLIDGILYRARQIERTGRKSLRVVLVEGKNREIRRVFSHFHLHPEKLVRVRVGPVCLGSLKEGESRPLSGEEISVFMRSKHDNSH